MRMGFCVLRSTVGLETGDGDGSEVCAPRRIREGGREGGRKKGRKEGGGTAPGCSRTRARGGCDVEDVIREMSGCKSRQIRREENKVRSMVRLRGAGIRYPVLAAPACFYTLPSTLLELRCSASKHLSTCALPESIPHFTDGD